MTIRRVPSDFLVEERISLAAAAGVIPFSADAARSTTVRHAVYALTKESLTTPDAVAHLARALGSTPGHAAYAGLKDKHARTVQWVSFPFLAKSADPPPASTQGQGWSATLVGLSANECDASWIDGNRFTIIVRDLARESADEMARRARLLALDNSTLLFTNYFGAQRFGSARHGQGFAAIPLIRGDFESALKLLVASPARKDSGKTRVLTRLAATHWGNWPLLARELPKIPERRAFELLRDRTKSSAATPTDFRDAFATLPAFTQTMCVEAFQSHLWNTAVRLLAEHIGAPDPDHIASTLHSQHPTSAPPLHHTQHNKHSPQHKPHPHTKTPPAPPSPPQTSKPKPLLLRSDDEYGEMIFPHATRITQDWRSLILPIPAASTTLTPPWGQALAAALESESLSLTDLKIPNLRRPFFGEAPRPLFATASNFSMSPPQPDDLASSPKRLKRTLTFDLPKGSYATVVLRALGQ
jgi:TruD family tRNA pseudouridine synthase